MVSNICKNILTAEYIILLFTVVIRPLVGWLSLVGDHLGAIRLPETREPVGRGTKKEEKNISIEAIPKGMEYRKLVSKHAIQDPQHTTELIRKWLRETRGSR